MVITRHDQSTQNIAISLQYLKKKGGNEVDFLCADKHQIFIKVDTINFDGHGHALIILPAPPSPPKKKVSKKILMSQEWSGLIMF